MAPQTWPQPLVVVRDVPGSSRFYQRVLGAGLLVGLVVGEQRAGRGR